MDIAAIVLLVAVFAALGALAVAKARWFSRRLRRRPEHGWSRRRATRALVGVAVGVAFVLGTAGSASADAPDPSATPNAMQTTVTHNADGTNTVSASGTWQWPTHTTDCNVARYAAGWAMAWGDPNDAGYLLAGTSGASAVYVGSRNSTDNAVHYYDGTTGQPRCGVFASHGSSSYNTGNWGPISHTYAASVTTVSVCPVMFDVHSVTANNTLSVKAGDLDVTQNSDNSVVKNASGVSSCSPPITINLGAPNLAAAKTGPATGTAGGSGSYTVTVTNSGTAASTATSVVDRLPAGETFHAAGSSAGCAATAGNTVTCAVPALAAPGGAVSFTIVADYGVNTAGQALADCAQLAGVSGTGPCVTTTMANSPSDLRIVKTASAANVHPGDALSYTLTVSNVGGLATTGTLSVTDTVPSSLGGFTLTPGAGWNCSSVGRAVTCASTAALGASASRVAVTIASTVNANASGSITNTGTVASSVPADDSVSTNNTSTVLTPITPTSTTSPSDLTIVKTASAANVHPGDALSYTLTVSNVGGLATTGTLSVTDTVPSSLGGFTLTPGAGWNCSSVGRAVTCASTAALGASASRVAVTIASTVNANASGSITNTGTVASSVPADDSVSTNNTSTVLTPITPTGTPAQPDLAVTKTGPAELVAGQNGVYTLTVANTGSISVSAFTLTDTLPIGETFVSAAGTGWSCTASGQIVTCTHASALAPGARTAITLTVHVAADVPVRNLTNTVALPLYGDLTPGDNTATVTTPVLAVAGEAFTDPPATPGGNPFTAVNANPTTLAFTGFDASALALLGGGLLGLGGALLVGGSMLFGSRRRRKMA